MPESRNGEEKCDCDNREQWCGKNPCRNFHASAPSAGRVTEPSEEQLDALLNHWSAPKRGDVSHDYRQGYLAARDYALNTLRLGPSADFPPSGETGEGEQTEDEEGVGTPDLVSAIDVRRAIEETTAELERLRNPRTTWQLYLWDRLFPCGPKATGQQEAVADPKTEPGIPAVLNAQRIGAQLSAPATNVTERVEAALSEAMEAIREAPESYPPDGVTTITAFNLARKHCLAQVELVRERFTAFLGEAGNEGASGLVSREIWEPIDELGATGQLALDDSEVAWLDDLLCAVLNGEAMPDHCKEALSVQVKVRTALDTGGDDEH